MGLKDDHHEVNQGEFVFGFPLWEKRGKQGMQKKARLKIGLFFGF